MPSRIRLLTYNIRKGKGASGRLDGSVKGLSEALAAQRPDLLVCQEVFHGHRLPLSQTKDLGDGLGLEPFYEPNRRRKIGHHGNATFARFPALAVQNHNISTNPIEKRGVLYVKVQVDGRVLHVFNAHLGLNQRQRSVQIRQIASIMTASCPADEPVVLAGDFNDWNRSIDGYVTRHMGLCNTFAHLKGRESFTWHARRPVFNLDRVYVRHLRSCATARLAGAPWNELSDHYPLCVELELP